MRVISGSLKGRKILGYNIEGTRPTMDRVKESVFGIIQNDVKGAVILDLFAGSGNLGIEAISNGSSFCYFVDNNKFCIKFIRDNVNNLNIDDKCQIICNDYNKALAYFKENDIKFDIVFIDPPYKYNIINELVNKILAYGLLNDKGLLVLEYQNDILRIDDNSLVILKNKRYGDKFVCFCKKK